MERKSSHPEQQPFLLAEVVFEPSTWAQRIVTGRLPQPREFHQFFAGVFSECQQYRYQLREMWDSTRPFVLWLLMNPSVACLEHSDPTLRKTGTFARAWGCGGQLVGNVHAYRATDKSRLLEVGDPVGPENDRMILKMAAEAKMVVLAYGQPPKALRARGGGSGHAAAPPPPAMSSSTGSGWHSGPPALPAIHPPPQTSHCETIKTFS